MQTIRYYLIDMTNIYALKALKEFNALHKEVLPKNNLSITYNNDLTKAIIKVCNNKEPDHGTELINTYLKRDHYKLIDMLINDPNWMDSTKTEEQLDALRLQTSADKLRI